MVPSRSFKWNLQKKRKFIVDYSIKERIPPSRSTYIRQTLSHSSGLIKPQSCINTRRNASLRKFRRSFDKDFPSEKNLTSIVFPRDLGRSNGTYGEPREHLFVIAGRSDGRPRRETASTREAWRKKTFYFFGLRRTNLARCLTTLVLFF